ncbi:MAG: E2/UBC family protein [Hyphomicrobium sp.]
MTTHAEQNSQPDHHLGNHHDQRWKLNVQGVIVESDQPIIVVRDAIQRAGFDPAGAWIIVLKIAGEPKKPVELSTEIDLRHEGIEKLRLMPKQIDNGEAQSPRRLDFALLPQDEEHLDRLGLRWETALDGQRRWLTLSHYGLPGGYTAAHSNIAIEVPTSYPTAQLDMFYCHPPLVRQTGGIIAQTEHFETICGVPHQRWSRHRQWDMSRDTLATHLALVDESLRREVEA